MIALLAQTWCFLRVLTLLRCKDPRSLLECRCLDLIRLRHNGHIWGKKFYIKRKALELLLTLIN